MTKNWLFRADRLWKKWTIVAGESDSASLRSQDLTVWFTKFNWHSFGLKVINLPFEILMRGINPRLTGGGAFDAPLPNIRDSSKTNSAIDVKLGSLLIQQFDIVREFLFKNPSENFEIWSILWRHYTPLLVEKWPNFAGLWKTQFFIKTQMENTKRRKMRSSTRWLSRFSTILGFWPLKFKKNRFFLENDP